MIARGVVVATVHWRVMGAFNTCDTHKSSGRPTSRVPRERAVTQALSARVQLCALRRPPVTPRARGESIDRTRARRGGKTNISMGVVAMSQGARPSPVPRRPFPRSRHRRRRPETKGGIPLSAGRDPSLSDEPMTSHPRRTDVPPTPTTQSQRRRGCAP